MKTYKGKYRPKAKDKYAGDPDKVVYRSQWEKWVMLWCDKNPDVVKWCSEEVVVPYLCETDNKMHRYFIDFYIQFKDGTKYIIEVKPENQTKLPTKRGKNKRKQLNEGLTYIKNISKWKAANAFAKKNGLKFEIWTEKTLKSKGIMKF